MTLLEENGTDDVPIVARTGPFIGGVLIDQYAQGIWRRFGGRTQPARNSMCVCDLCNHGQINRGLFVGNQTAQTPVAPANLERIAMIRQRLQQWMYELTKLIES